MRRAFVALSLLLGTALSSREAAADNVAITDEARTHFSAGVSFLKDPDGARYDDAYREFKAAYAASPSWKILGNLGIAAMKLERDGEAIEAFTKYLSEGGKELDREERAQVDRDLKTLQAGVVTLALSFEPAAALLTDERVPVSGASVVNRYGPVSAKQSFGIRAGHHRVSVELEGYEKAVWEFDAVPKQQLSYGFGLTPAPRAAQTPVTPAPLAPAPSAPPPAEASGSNALRIGSYVALGVGVVGVGLGTVFALKAKSKYHDANAICPSFPCDITQAEADRRSSLGDDGDSAKTLSAVGFVVGGVGIAAGVTLFVISGKKGSATENVALAPFILPGSAGVRGSF